MNTIIGYCPVCGEPVIAQSAKRKNKIYCSDECGHRASDRRRRGLPISDKENGYAPKPKRQPKKSAREIKLEHLAARDAAYAASPYAAQVTVVERNGVIIETRGTPCFGSRHGMLVTNKESQGVHYE